ncbi:hypothetical protein Tco_0537619, partial [Tanacetum coccineum]
CLADPTLHVPLDEIQVDANLNFVEEPVEVLEREFKKLNRSCSDVVAFACVILSLLLEVALCNCSSTGRPLGAYNLGVATPRALVYVGLMTSRDARSWFEKRCVVGVQGVEAKLSSEVREVVKGVKKDCVVVFKVVNLSCVVKYCDK